VTRALGAGRPAVAPALLFALGFMTMGGACSTTYQPQQRSGRVVIVIHRGAALYVKDGRQEPIGPFGGDLPALVAETPEAATAAHRARNQLAAGVPIYVGGAAAIVTGLLLAGPVGWVVLGLGAASAATGLSLMGAGFTNAVDAVNLQNDATPAPAPRTTPAR
jgi:hypothetical protein